MNQTNKSLIAYRWIVFLLALGFAVYNLTTADWANFGGSFRKLTIWGLLFSLFASACMLALSYERNRGRLQILPVCTAVLNTMVVFLYWKLYLIDPTLVHDKGDGALTPNNLYLHAVGPGLQILDALFFRRAFSKPAIRAVFPVIAIVFAYVLWAEFVLQALSSFPTGSVTSGLPYRFLNSMEFAQRAEFYAQNVAVALGILVGLRIIGWALRKFSKPIG